jgi:tetratricopeptide (TPR) repeat protein
MSNSKQSSNGAYCYKQNDVYYRNGDSSEPAKGEALVNIVVGRPIGAIGRIVDHNLPVRDRTFTQFVGRRDQLDQLWRWFLDNFNTTRLVAGVGGVGKTTLVREFVEEVISQSPGNIERVVWLSAKSNNFDAHFNKLVEVETAYEHKFSNEIDLYVKLFLAVGGIDSDINTDWPRERFMSAISDALKVTPTLVVVDDLDSLDHDMQLNIFSTLSLLFHSLSFASGNASRCIATARLRLGASAAQYHELRGFLDADFFEYLKYIYEQYRIKFELNKDTKLFKNFHRFSHGSPLFTTSIIRLVASGVPLDRALKNWQDAEGEDVRDFAFKREVDRLSNGQLKILYALLLLTPCSLEEIMAATEIAEKTITTEIGRLSEYHLLSRDPTVGTGGREFLAPGNASLLMRLVVPKLENPRQIERNSHSLRSEKKSHTEDVSLVIGKMVSLWKLEEHQKAYDYILRVRQKSRADNFHPDLECMLGRAALRANPPDLQRADLAFGRAHLLKCERVELLPLWIECRQLRGDWGGVIELCEKALEDKVEPQRMSDLGDAYFNLGTDHYVSGNVQSAVDIYIKGGKILNSFIANYNLSDYFQKTNYYRKECFTEALRIAIESTKGMGDSIHVYENSWIAFECFVRTPFVITTLAKCSVQWAEFAANMRRTTTGDIGKLEQILQRQSKVSSILSEKTWSYPDLVNLTRISIDSLSSLKQRMELNVFGSN